MNILDFFERVVIPENIKNVKIDVGLSFNAPYSNLWLSTLKDRFVFGFEPNKFNIESITSGKGFEHLLFKDRLSPKHIGVDFAIIPAALDNVSEIENRDFYCTLGDPGCSSLYKPVDGNCTKITVPCISLRMFFDKFPWERFPYIEHLKIDAQGNDLRILQSAGEYLKDRIVFVTVESANERFQYNCDKENSGHTREQLLSFMKENGFDETIGLFYECGSLKLLDYKHKHAYNLTFVNKTFIDISKNLDCGLLWE